MSNVVVSNKSLSDQRIGNIDSNKVLLPFNVNKEQVEKLKGILSKIDAIFSYDLDKLSISSMAYMNSKFKDNNRDLSNCKFTLSNTYVATIKQSIVNKVKTFYDKIIKPQEQVPVFGISKETNLQEALNEATQEINLTELNAALNKPLPEEKPIENYQQVLANDATGVITTFGGDMNAKNELNQVVTERTNEAISNPTPIPVQPIVNNPEPQVQPAINPQPTFNTINNVEQQQVPNNLNTNIPLPETYEQAVPVQPNVKVKKLKGNVLVIPIVIIWLGLVLVGTIKLVTSILT